MPAVLLVRAMLVMPFLLGQAFSPPYRRTIYIAGIGVVAAQAFTSLRNHAHPMQELWEAFTGHPAVRALAQDAVIAICGSAIYYLV